MNRQENIKKLYEQARLDTIAEKDKAVLEKMKEIYLQESKAESKPSELSVWRIIMKSKITKFAAAAVIIIGVLITIHYSVGSIDPASVALGKTIENMRKMPWVHWQLVSGENDKNILESWFGFDSGIFASIQFREGKVIFNNSKDKTEYTYNQKDNVLYFSHIEDGIRESDYIPNSPFEFIEVMMDLLDKEASEIKRQTLIENGKEIEIITAKMPDESKYKQIEFSRDIQMNLLLMIKVDSKDAGNSVIALNDYPSKGPANIYDLGVPKDAKIVYSFLPEEIQELIKKLNSLRQTNLTRYVAVSIPANIEKLPMSFEGRRPERYFTTKDNLISSIWRKGNERLHSMGYYEESKNKLTLDNLSENIQNCAELLTPVAEDIYKAGENRMYHYQILNGESIRNTHNGEVEVYGREVFIEQICWPQITVPRQSQIQWKLEYDTGSGNENLIMIERDTRGFRDRWLLDPAHNYICRKYEHSYSDGRPILSIEILEYANTQSNQWYPQIIQKTEYQTADSTEQKQICTRVIYLQENPSFPEGIFDPDTLPKSDQ